MLAAPGRSLFKQEPTHYPFESLIRDGRAVWDGVENNQALIYLRKVKKGDLILFYHSGKERQVVGVMKAISDSYVDPHKKDGRLVVVDVAPVKKLAKPVTL